MVDAKYQMWKNLIKSIMGSIIVIIPFMIINGPRREFIYLFSGCFIAFMVSSLFIDIITSLFHSKMIGDMEREIAMRYKRCLKK